MQQLQAGGNGHQFFSQTLPERWQLEAYRRPLLELVQKLKIKSTDRYESPREYQQVLTDSLRGTAAYKHDAETDPTLTEAPARLLLAQLRERAPFERLAMAFATALGLPAEHHFWTKEEQEQFVTAWKAARQTLHAWEFPEDRNLTNAKDKLSAQVQAVRVEFGLTPVQLRKILDDLMP